MRVFRDKSPAGTHISTIDAHPTTRATTPRTTATTITEATTRAFSPLPIPDPGNKKVERIVDPRTNRVVVFVRSQKSSLNALRQVTFQLIDYCEVEPCSNGGTCINQPDDDSYVCECPSQYTGRHCERKCVRATNRIRNL